MLTEPANASCIGGNVHRKTSQIFSEPRLFVQGNEDRFKLVITTEMLIGVYSVIPITLLELQCRSEQLLSYFNYCSLSSELFLAKSGIGYARAGRLSRSPYQFEG
jgi:hypothetical protein